MRERILFSVSGKGQFGFQKENEPLHGASIEAKTTEIRFLRFGPFQEGNWIFVRLLPSLFHLKGHWYDVKRERSLCRLDVEGDLLSCDEDYYQQIDAKIFTLTQTIFVLYERPNRYLQH
jgi:hypothetical protein